MSKSKVFITGINSGLGKNLYEYFSSQYDVYGLSKKVTILTIYIMLILMIF